MSASQFYNCHSERRYRYVQNPDLAQGLRSFAPLHSAQDDNSGMHPERSPTIAAFPYLRF